jgi:hypothetical protein
MNTMNVHDVNSNEDVPPHFIAYANNIINNLQVHSYEELKIPKVINAKVHDYAYITKMHLENLQNYQLFWKLHYHTLFMWAFLKVNYNQPMDLKYKHIMRCIICQNDSIGSKILAMHTMCKKGLITCHKFNDITTMKKRIVVDHFVLVKKLVKDLRIAQMIVQLDQEASKKRAHVTTFATS